MIGSQDDEQFFYDKIDVRNKERRAYYRGYGIGSVVTFVATIALLLLVGIYA